MGPRRCILTLGIAEEPPADHPQIVRDFKPAIARLETSLAEAGYAGAFASWSEKYPEGCPSHRDSPCAFKPFCLSEAAAAGYELVLWLDATVQAIRPIEPLFECVERDGYLIFAEDHSVGEYCKDEALGPLGITREESFSMRSCWACALGLDLRNPLSLEFLERWKELAVDGVTFPGPRWSGFLGFPQTASADPRVKGHRYDQTAASVLALRLGMTKWRSKEFFSYFLKNTRRSVPTVAVGNSHPPPKAAEAGTSPIRVLFFTRGKGRGHTIPAIAVADELAHDSRFEIQFVSYGAGADAIRSSGRAVIDLSMADDRPFFSILLQAHAVIKDFKPDVVVTLQEWAVLPVGRMCGIPAILLTEWFPPPEKVSGESVSFADSIVFLGEPGIFRPPPAVPATMPLFVGPVVRKMRYDTGDRAKARRELGLEGDAYVVSVIPGAWATEAKWPIAQIVLPAFRQLRVPRKKMFWLTQADHDALQQLSAGVAEIEVLKDGSPVERIMVASDVVVTKGNRGTIMEAASLGVPSVSLSPGANPVDDALVPMIASNKAYRADAVTPDLLCAYLEKLATIPPDQRARPLGLHLRGGEQAATALGTEIRRLVLRKNGPTAAAI